MLQTELLDEFDHMKKEGPVEVITYRPDDSDLIGFRNATFSWSIDTDGTLTPSRRNYRLRVEDELLFKRGAINLIIGPTGSGKTSMLMALLGEYRTTLLSLVLHSSLMSAQVKCISCRLSLRHGSTCQGIKVLHTLRKSHGYKTRPFAYVILIDLETGSVLNRGIKDNILFGAPYDEVRYKKGGP